MKKILIAFLAIYSCSFGQNQNNQWRFGFGSAIDFNTNPLSFPSGTALPSILPPFITGTLIEGTASIADKNTGELLFYTDGVSVWNALNQPMPNGSNLGGSDWLSSYMAAVIIPMPSSCDKYYIFCIDDYEEGSDGISYSIVDMSLDNNLGDVVSGQKSIPLFDNNETELLMVYPKSSGDGYWLISNGPDPLNPTIAAFEITSQGVSNIPVLSPVNLNGTGKLNNQGTKFISTGDFDPINGNSLGFRLYDFDATTGQISNPVNIPFNVPGGDVLQYFEFTLDGNYLFAGANYSVYQFDLTSGDPATIAASGLLVPFSNVIDPHAALQNGPDGNMYHVIGSDLYQIENPSNSPPGPINALSASLSPSNCLPQWIFLLPENTTQSFITQSIDSCNQIEQIFSVTSNSTISSIQWDFGDLNSGANNSSIALNPTHEFSNFGSYQISAIIEFNCFTDTITQNITLLECPDSLNPTLPFVFPNVITPNSDGVNDLFEIQNLPDNTEVIILNRWGNIIYSATNYQNTWDGKDASGKELFEGVYTYQFKTESGKTGHGFLHLIR